MLKIPLTSQIDKCLDCDLEVTATLIDAICFSFEINAATLINTKHSELAIKFFLNGASIDIEELIAVYECEDINFICLPPLIHIDTDLESLFNPYYYYKDIKVKDIDRTVTGFIELNASLVSNGLSILNSFSTISTENPITSIINLGKDFHFFTNNYTFGTLFVIK